MGGRGSGRTSGYGFLVDKCEDYLSIDLAFLRKRNAFHPRNSGEISWSRRNEKYASVQYVVEAVACGSFTVHVLAAANGKMLMN